MAKEDIVPKWASFKSGITHRSVLAVIYSLVVFTPAAIYMQLMTGTGGLQVSWFTLLLWIELSKLSGTRVSKQEALMILLLASAAPLYSVERIYGIWYRTSDIALKFEIGPHIPNWAIPPASAGILELRTFWHSAWVVPIAIGLYSALFGHALLDTGLSLFSRELFIETERLPFPIQQMQAAALITMTGEKRRPLQILSIFAGIGFGYGFVLYALPTLWQAWTGKYLQFIPIPWIDLSSAVQNPPLNLKGAIFGVATDLIPFATGFIVPFWVVTGMLISSFAIYFFGNWLTVIYNLGPDTDLSPGYQPWWVPGMNIQMAWQRSVMYVWASIAIGFSFAVGFAPIIRYPRRFVSALKSFSRPSVGDEKRLTEPINTKLIALPMIIIGLIGGVVIFYMLVPDFVHQFPLIIPMIIIFPLVSTIMTGRTLGVTGTSISPTPATQLTNIIYFTSGYEGVDVWFAPNFMSREATMLSALKLCELTETKASSYIILTLAFIPVSIVFSYFFMELFWKIAPIPSGRYPGAAIYWPIQATMQSIWIRGRVTGLFQIPWAIGSFIIGTALYFILDLIRCPVSFIALGTGIGVITPVALTNFIGAVVGRIAYREKGEWWDENSRLVAAGITLGEGIAITISVAIALILQSIWTLPF